jgi:rod shape-determining protein MreD
MRQSAGYIVLSILFVLLQTTLARYLAIETIAPDLLLIWVVYLALREGQVAATTAGFFIGFLFDLISGKDSMLGLAALCKTVAGFAAGYFYNENKISQILGGYQFILVVAVASTIHNVLYFVVFLQGTEVGWLDAVVLYGFPTTVYTAALAFLPMFVFSRRSSRLS